MTAKRRADRSQDSDAVVPELDVVNVKVDGTEPTADVVVPPLPVVNVDEPAAAADNADGKQEPA